MLAVVLSVLHMKLLLYVSCSALRLAHEATPVCEYKTMETHSTSYWVDFRVLTSCGPSHGLLGGISINLTVALHPADGDDLFL